MQQRSRCTNSTISGQSWRHHCQSQYGRSFALSLWPLPLAFSLPLLLLLRLLLAFQAKNHEGAGVSVKCAGLLAFYQHLHLPAAPRCAPVRKSLRVGWACERPRMNASQVRLLWHGPEQLRLPVGQKAALQHFIIIQGVTTGPQQLHIFVGLAASPEQLSYRSIRCNLALDVKRCLGRANHHLLSAEDRTAAVQVIWVPVRFSWQLFDWSACTPSDSARSGDRVACQTRQGQGHRC